ncbi:hypothetical protein DPMN_060557 [Dreissena polymorpha]|uniref:Uncharacterized protein n=1 Tax=Dreissena polymorpha TaxID=45954 RepID=A0A9D4C5F7_DREPO|nr:hypothetical protein DPMN_060557 [Dreissena polymorpha]
MRIRFYLDTYTFYIFNYTYSVLFPQEVQPRAGTSSASSTYPGPVIGPPPVRLTIDQQWEEWEEMAAIELFNY